MRFVKNIGILLICTMLILPAVQHLSAIVPEPPLKGFDILKSPPDLKFFTWRRWFSGTFQEEFTARLGDHIGFRNTLVHINSQFDYTLFDITHAAGFIAGKKGYLFEEDYIHEYNGDYFIGRKVIENKVRLLKNVQDSMAACGIPLVVVYEPGKASFFPEYIPGRFLRRGKGPSNFDCFIQSSQQQGLKFIDLNSYFQKLKDTSHYPLFPRYGMHWSLYGVALAMDTLTNYLRKGCGLQVPSFATVRLEEDYCPRGTDNDIGEILNLAFPLPKTFGIYPQLRFNPDPAARKLRVLIIADSYYLNIVEDFGNNLFKEQVYWYYNKKLYPNQNGIPPTYVDKSGLRCQLRQFDLVLLMSSEINLHCGFWDFAEEAYRAWHPEVPERHIYTIGNQIRNEREWFRFIVDKARKENRPLEEMITNDAEYMFFTGFSDLAWKTYPDSIDYIRMEILKNSEWYEAVRKKAAARAIASDSMLTLDAIYMYDLKRGK